MTAIHNPQSAIRNPGSRVVAAAVVVGVCLRVLFALGYWLVSQALPRAGLKFW